MAKANNPDTPPDDGEIKSPKIDGGMNKLPPRKASGKKTKPKTNSDMTRRHGERPAVSAANVPNGASDEAEDGDKAEDEDPDAKGSKTKPEKPDSEEDDADILARVRKRFKLCVA